MSTTLFTELLPNKEYWGTVLPKKDEKNVLVRLSKASDHGRKDYITVRLDEEIQYKIDPRTGKKSKVTGSEERSPKVVNFFDDWNARDFDNAYNGIHEMLGDETDDNPWTSEQPLEVPSCFVGAVYQLAKPWVDADGVKYKTISFFLRASENKDISLVNNALNYALPQGAEWLETEDMDVASAVTNSESEPPVVEEKDDPYTGMSPAEKRRAIKEEK